MKISDENERELTEEEKILNVKKLATIAYAGEMLAYAAVANGMLPEQMQILVVAYAQKILRG